MTTAASTHCSAARQHLPTYLTAALMCTLASTIPRLHDRPEQPAAPQAATKKERKKAVHEFCEKVWCMAPGRLQHGTQAPVELTTTVHDVGQQD